jgi:hypothetical protein
MAEYYTTRRAGCQLFRKRRPKKNPAGIILRGFGKVKYFFVID